AATHVAAAHRGRTEPTHRARGYLVAARESDAVTDGANDSGCAAATAATVDDERSASVRASDLRGGGRGVWRRKAGTVPRRIRWPGRRSPWRVAGAGAGRGDPVRGNGARRWGVHVDCDLRLRRARRAGGRHAVDAGAGERGDVA